MLAAGQIEDARELRAGLLATAGQCERLADEAEASRPMQGAPLHLGQDLRVLAFREQGTHEKATREIETIVEGAGSAGRESIDSS